MRLYYYTGPDRIEQNLRNNWLKLSRFWAKGNLNDPFELAAYSLKDKEFRTAHRKVMQEFAKRIGFICLSQTRHSPLMWAHYANNHEGVCLELEVEYEPLFKVEYRSKKLFPQITLPTHKQYINNKNIKKVMGTKSKDWSYEREWRMHFDLENDAVRSDGNGMYFLPFQSRDGLHFQLKKIYVGYRFRLGIKNLQDLVKGYPGDVAVIQTRPAFQTFRVVRQVEKAHWNWETVPEGQLCPAEYALFGGEG